MTLYEMLEVPETVSPEMVAAAALVDGGGITTAERKTALAVLSDPAARADYDARAEQGLPFELALAWGVADYAAGNVTLARDHWERARRIAPENRAAAMLAEAIADDPAQSPEHGIPEELRAEARAEIERLRQNSAFPHRLIRYAEALARPDAEEDAGEGEDAAVVVGASRELLQYDIAEAPRAYAMVLPVLREHYRAVYALDAPFFNATASILTRHTPRAEYERKKATRKPPPGDGSVWTDRPRLELPPLEVPQPRMRRPVLGTLPPPGPAWVGALFGALLGLRMGLPGMLRGAIFGFIITYLVLVVMERRR